MKKLNLLRTAAATMFMFCFMAVAFMCTNIDAQAATPAFSVNGGQVILTDQNGQKVQGKAVNVLANTTSGGYTVNAGIYYFNESGYLADLPNATYGVKVSNMTSTSLTSETQLILAKGTTSVDTQNKILKPNATLFKGFLGAQFYYDGALYNGFYWDSSSQTMFWMTNGNGKVCSGVAIGNYYHSNNKRIVSTPAGGMYVINGKYATGIANGQYYQNGKMANISGWKDIDGKTYYLKSGKPATGWNVLPSYGQGVLSYKYYFDANGVLCKDLIDLLGYNYFIQLDIKIVSNKTTHNTTFYFKDTDGTYVPAKTIICATARKKGDTPTGTFRLEKTWNKRWFIYKKTHGAPWRYYQWAVKIKGTSSLYHSSTYKKKKANTLRADLYNALGTSCTTHCIRHQAKYAKLIYDIATKTNKKRRVPVQIITSANEGPFGHVSLTKVAPGTKWDPTDPFRPN